MTRTHYSGAALDTSVLRDVVQDPLPHRKPNGLWWAFGTDWHDYASNKKPRGAYVNGPGYAVEILAGAKILTLGSVQDIDDFTIKYGRPHAYARPGAPADRCIDWASVAQNYDGIEISALLRDQRDRLEWLDIDWSVASGCAWRPDSCVRLTPMTAPELVKKPKPVAAPRIRSAIPSSPASLDPLSAASLGSLVSKPSKKRKP